MAPKDLIARARALQEAYWTPNAAEKRRLLAGDVDRLDGSQLFRLLHLACLDLAATGPVALALADEEADASDAPAGPERDLIVRLLQIRTDRRRGDGSWPARCRRRPGLYDLNYQRGFVHRLRSFSLGA